MFPVLYIALLSEFNMNFIHTEGVNQFKHQGYNVSEFQAKLAVGVTVHLRYDIDNKLDAKITIY